DGMPPYYPMARAIAGGLAFSTVVSLLFLPTIYAILDDLRTGTARLVRRARGLDTGGAAPSVPAAAAEQDLPPANGKARRKPGFPFSVGGAGFSAPACRACAGRRSTRRSRYRGW